MIMIIACLLFISIVLIGLGLVAANADSGNASSYIFHEDMLNSDGSSLDSHYVNSLYLQKDSKNYHSVNHQI